MMEEDAQNLQIESERMEFEADAKVIATMLENETLNNSKDSNILVEDLTTNQATTAKHKRHSWGQKTMGNELVGGHLRRHSSMMAIPSRYLSGSTGSCHDSCKAGHGHESDEKTKGHLARAPSGRSVLLRSQSERKDPPKVALLGESCEKKSRSKLLGRSSRKVHPANASRPSKPSVKRATSMNARNEGIFECPLHGKNQTNRQREAKDKKPKEALTRKNQVNCQRDAKPKEPEDVPEKMLYMIEPIKTCQEATLCEKESSIEGSKDSSFPKSILPMILKPFKHQAKEGEHGEDVSVDSTPRSKQSVELDQPRDKASSTWSKIKEATIAALSPRKRKFRQQESTDGDQNGEVKNRKGSYKTKEIDREEPHGKAGELGQVVLRHHQTINEPEAIKSGKYTVKTLVGAFEALISFGDVRSLVAAKAS